MEKFCLVLFIISLVGVIPQARSWAQSFQFVEKDEAANETVTNLQFYFHDTLSGNNPSAVRVAQSSETAQSPTLFGALVMADDPLTEGPDANSKLLGRAQGLYGSAGQSDISLIMALNLEFTDGVYNGSSISLLGQNSAMTPVREMSIIGGTGFFRLARGYVVAQTYSMTASGDAIVHYNVTIVHSDLNLGSTDSIPNGLTPNIASSQPKNFSPTASLFQNQLSVALLSFFMVCWSHCGNVALL